MKIANNFDKIFNLNNYLSANVTPNIHKLSEK
jgi:hypothetical protein